MVRLDAVADVKRADVFGVEFPVIKLWEAACYGDGVAAEDEGEDVCS